MHSRVVCVDLEVSTGLKLKVWRYPKMNLWHQYGGEDCIKMSERVGVLQLLQDCCGRRVLDSFIIWWELDCCWFALSPVRPIIPTFSTLLSAAPTNVTAKSLEEQHHKLYDFIASLSLTFSLFLWLDSCFPFSRRLNTPHYTCHISTGIVVVATEYICIHSSDWYTKNQFYTADKAICERDGLICKLNSNLFARAHRSRKQQQQRRYTGSIEAL